MPSTRSAQHSTAGGASTCADAVTWVWGTKHMLVAVQAFCTRMTRQHSAAGLINSSPQVFVVCQ
jgi:hypothetical protein